MCQLHFYKCACGARWTEAKKLSSCDDPGDPEARCPESLCLLVGNPRRPQKKECEGCRTVREMLESMEDEQEELDESFQTTHEKAPSRTS
ncbi:hypothetical protein GE09DRAFT_1230472 [Coniochaeta sp. 2T2.1]|nr:hypothetical protein GE09DRAFT_1230472 [Coniochaeta sp. 2T2.1]